MRDVVQNNKEAKAIVEHELGMEIKDPYSGLLLHDDGNLIGACVFTSYKPYFRDVEFTCVLLKPDVGMRIARRVAWFVFKNLNCHRCTAITARSNNRAQTALESIGFHVEGYLREYFPNNEDGIVYGLLRSEQKLLRRVR